MKTLLVTGSSGLIGSEVCQYFANEGGYTIHGVDNNQRAVFFGPQGDTRWNQHRLERELKGFVHHELDIRDRAGVRALLERRHPAILVEWFAQYLARFDTRPDDLLRIADRYQYRIFTVPAGVPVDDARALQAQMIGCQNFMLLSA